MGCHAGAPLRTRNSVCQYVCMGGGLCVRNAGSTRCGQSHVTPAPMRLILLGSRRNLTLVVVGRFAPFGSSVRLLTRAVGGWALRSGGDRRVQGVVFPDGKVPLAR